MIQKTFHAPHKKGIAMFAIPFEGNIPFVWKVFGDSSDPFFKKGLKLGRTESATFPTTFSLFYAHFCNTVCARCDDAGPVGMIDHKTGLAAGRLFDVAHEGVINFYVLSVRAL